MDEVKSIRILSNGKVEDLKKRLQVRGWKQFQCVCSPEEDQHNGFKRSSHLQADR